MKSIEIESWALRVLEQLEKGAPVEDSRVELKAGWLEADKAARRIAAHANAARADEILWLIGADEKRGIVGADHQELSKWWAQAKSVFDGIAPELHDLIVSYKDKWVVALCFDSSRRPFVVKNQAFGKPAGGPVEFEVPWREGTAVRTATRNDLILLLVPLLKSPKIEIVGGQMRVNGTGEHKSLDFTLRAYVTPLADASVTFPFHKCIAVCTDVLATGSKIIAEDFQLRMDSVWAKELRERHAQPGGGYYGSSRPQTNVEVLTRGGTITATGDEIVIHGAGKIEIEGQCPMASAEGWRELRLTMTLVQAVSESKILFDMRFIKQKDPALVWDFAG